MKKVLLAILMTFGAIAFQSSRADASGATIVFLQVRVGDYILSHDIRDVETINYKLYNVLESSDSDSYVVANVDPAIYRYVYYYSSYGYDVELRMDQFEDITFHYYKNLSAIIGVGEDGKVIILLPKSAKQMQPRPPKGGSSSQLSSGNEDLDAND